MTTDGLADYASQFEAPEGYLDFARYGPPSRAVLAATADALGRSARADHDTVNDLMRADLRARQAAARLAGTDAEHTVLLPNASTGLFQAAFGVPAGTVLVPAADFPANHYPWRRAAAAGLAVPRWLASAPTPEAVRAALTDDVVAVSLSAVDFRTGYRADLAALRDVIGPDRLLVVDAMQAFGVVEMPWQAADVVVVGGQKWLRASWSTGFAALSDRALERLAPTLTGWTGVDDVALFDDREHPPAPGAGRLSITNLSPVAAAALAAALEVLEAVGVPAVEARVRSLVDRLLDEVRAHGAEILSATAPARRAGIVSFRLPGTDPATVAKALHAQGVTPTVRPDSLRLSPHASTPPAAVDLVRTALASLR
ncbi:aminotransferase class V-fold PLP-dependent enzyme [Actinacidiphila paucisporea]|uniref:Selenocysteine lyase/Cysteine desulfurase n=1 Tax=Actinacidiphila paucisporea TaxID=310782 RepID=A0A1M6WH68_9ACTN|nr:aminotransferase class V-fold PLP-dependent enzyme [Actinacidiphila paucisporea]SHK93067.1 Selenocysteine lyase/Cysteine desulfurase [Actinacidiphila paucisporea]